MEMCPLDKALKGEIDYCDDEDAEIYSDVFTIDSELESVKVVKKENV